MEYTEKFKSLCNEYGTRIGFYMCLDKEGKVVQVGSSKKVGQTLLKLKHHIYAKKYFSVRLALIESNIDAQIYTLLYRAKNNTNGVTEDTQFLDVTPPEFLGDVEIYKDKTVAGRMLYRDASYLSVQEISELINIAPNVVSKYCKKYPGFVKAKKIGKRWYISKKSVNAILKIREMSMDGADFQEIINNLSIRN